MRDLRPLALLAAVAASLALAACGSSTKCTAGQTNCFGTCRDLQTDALSCGQCGLQCAPGGACVSGACTCPPATPVACAGGCADLATDARNCGACGHDCGQGSCVAGACACTSPAVDCGPASHPQCVDTQNDYVNCGACGLQCTRSGGICSGGACACPSARPDFCSAANLCTDTKTDASHCGTCGTACTIQSQVCQAGACACPSAKPDTCGTACVNRQTDARNCGTCGRTCASGTCTAGKCCPGAQVECGALCCDGGCCPGGTCMLKHDAGVTNPAVTFTDCNPLGSAGAAQAAAQAWRPGGSPVTTYNGVGCGFQTECVAWNAGTAPNQCAVWCYAGTWAGKVSVDTISGVCACPTSLSGPWH